MGAGGIETEMEKTTITNIGRAELRGKQRKPQSDNKREKRKNGRLKQNDHVES